MKRRDSNQTAISEEALQKKQKAENEHELPHPDPNENAGLDDANTPREDYPPSGAFDAEGQRPALQRSKFPR